MKKTGEELNAEDQFKKNVEQFGQDVGVYAACSC